MTIRQDWDGLDAREVARLDTRLPAFGAPAARRMPPGKRAFDVTLALLLLVPLSVVMLAVAGLLALRQGRPIFYLSERMAGVDRSFTLWKFRTMTTDADDSGVSGGHKAGRVTPFGRVLRRTRLDELPQLWNILRGDMSFVGPRPPDRIYVERFPELYARILRNPPGVTGLASMTYHRHEERILSRCRTWQEADRAYTQRCIPRKARLDEIYERNRCLTLDLWIIIRTLGLVIRQVV